MQSHISGLTKRDEHIAIHQLGESEPAGHYNDWDLADEIADHMQEVYEITSSTLLGRLKRFMVLAEKVIRHQRQQISNPADGHRVREALSTWSTRTNWIEWRRYPKRERSEMRKTQMDGGRMYYGLNLHMLGVLGKHHDESYRPWIPLSGRR